MLSSASADPRDAWAMDSLLSLAPHVEWHRNHGCDKVSGLPPPHVQLCAELVALARERASADAVKEMPKEVAEWADSILELREAAQYFLASSPSAASSSAPQRWHRPPRAWIDRLTQEGLAVDELDDGGAWAVGKWAALLRVAASEAREANVSTAALPPALLPSDLNHQGSAALGEASRHHGPLRLLGEFNRVLDAVPLCFTGYARAPAHPRRPAMLLRELVFPEVKAAAWVALDATALCVTCRAWEHPARGTVNRHRAAKEVDRRVRIRHDRSCTRSCGLWRR